MIRTIFIFPILYLLWEKINALLSWRYIKRQEFKTTNAESAEMYFVRLRDTSQNERQNLSNAFNLMHFYYLQTITVIWKLIFFRLPHAMKIAYDKFQKSFLQMKVRSLPISKSKSNWKLLKRIVINLDNLLGIFWYFKIILDF